jgi:hypothetical protein
MATEGGKLATYSPGCIAAAGQTISELDPT